MPFVHLQRAFLCQFIQGVVSGKNYTIGFNNKRCIEYDYYIKRHCKGN